MNTKQPPPPLPSTRPYLIRAIYDWSLDSGCTPHILVSAAHEQVSVPAAYVQGGQIVLNLHPRSVHNLEMGNEYIMCSARFSGRRFELVVPVNAVLAVYSKENNQGIVFQEEAAAPAAGAQPAPQAPPKPAPKTTLKVVPKAAPQADAEPAGAKHAAVKKAAAKPAGVKKAAAKKAAAKPAAVKPAAAKKSGAKKAAAKKSAAKPPARGAHLKLVK